MAVRAQRTGRARPRGAATARRPAAPADAPRWSAPLKLCLAGAAVVLLLAGLRWSAPAPRSYDEYFHLGIAREMLDHGTIDSFRWTPFSIAFDRFVEKELLFHLLLLPFASLPLELATFWGTLLGQLFVVGALAWVLWTLRVPRPWWFLLALPALGTIFLARLESCRPHLLLIGFSILVVGLLSSRRWKALFVCSALFGLAHVGGWISVPLAVLWSLAGLVVREAGAGARVPWQPVAASAGGWFAGQLLHPAMPANFAMIALQNFVVPFQAGAARSAALYSQLGTELKPPDLALLREQWPALLLAAVAAVTLALQPRLRSRATLTATLSCLAFLAAAMRISRFFELGAPLALLAVALIARERALDGDGAELPAWARALVAVGLPLALLSTLTFATRYDTGKRSPPRQMAEWLGEHGQPGERVFTAQWADSSPLFYSAPQLQSLVAVDSTFFYEKDPALFATYTRIVGLRHPDPVTAIRQQFGARWVTVWKGYPRFGMQLQRRGAAVAYADTDYVIFDLGSAAAGS